MLNEAEPTLASCAADYAEHGIPVFPCLPGGKAPATPNGFHDASTDLDRVNEWWARQPNANIGMPTGLLRAGGGFDVLDVDVRATGNGFEAFHQARRAGLTDGWIRVVGTPSGGWHLYYPGSEQRNGSLRGEHLDFRAQGGYVLLPPSLGQTKAYSLRYRVLVESQPRPRPLDWAAIVQLLAPAPLPDPARHVPSRRGDPVGWLAEHVARQTEGNRNNSLYWATCRAVEAGAVDLDPLVAAGVQAGLDQREARRTVASAQAAGRRTRLPSPAPVPAAPSR